MLNNPTIDKLNTLRLIGMAKALKEQEQVDEIASFSFHERLGLMIDREMLERENRRLAIRLKRQSFGSAPASKMLITVTPGVWTNR